MNRIVLAVACLAGGLSPALTAAAGEAPGGEPAPKHQAPPMDAAAVEPLLKQLASEYNAEAAKAADALAEAGRAALPWLVKQTAARNDDLRRRVAGVLGRIREPEALDALHAMLADKADGVRRQVISAIGRHGKAESAGKLQEFLLHPNALLRLEAVMALGRIRSTQSVPALSRSCLDDDQLVRTAAVVALGLIADKAAIPALITGLDDDSILVRRLAHLVLKKLSGADLGYDPESEGDKRAESVRAWQTWWKTTGDTGGTTGTQTLKEK